MLNGKIALVTGASRGIGAAVAKALAAQGAHVVLAARDLAGLEAVDDQIQAAGGSATLVPLDLTNGPAIDELAATLAQRYGRLDILIGNAARLGELGPLAHIKPDVWEKTMNVNLTANWRLIRALDPLLRAADEGRAVFVTSGVTEGAAPYWGPYAVSKAALEMLAHTYAAEVANTRVKVRLVDPGVVRTRMRAEAFPAEDPDKHPLPDEIVGEFLEALVS